MGQYKVPQDVESEDTIIGPLTFRQFIYALIGVACGGISFALFKSVPIIGIIIGGPPTLLFLLLGLYKRQDQPFEAYFLALLGYMGRPKYRVWQKEPIESVFQIEAPPVEKKNLQLDPRLVRGQLETLARIVDTRGYSIKNADVQDQGEDQVLHLSDVGRLVQPAIYDVNVPIVESDIGDADDMFDAANNPAAHNLDSLIENTEANIREQMMARMQQVQAAPATAPLPPPVAPVAAPITETAAQIQQPSTSGMTPQPTPDIMTAATENDDLTVSQLAARMGGQVLPEGQSVSLRPDGQTPTATNS